VVFPRRASCPRWADAMTVQARAPGPRAAKTGSAQFLASCAPAPGAPDFEKRSGLCERAPRVQRRGASGGALCRRCCLSRPAGALLSTRNRYSRWDPLGERRAPLGLHAPPAVGANGPRLFATSPGLGFHERRDFPARSAQQSLPRTGCAGQPVHRGRGNCSLVVSAW